jgi:hypothetical protein
METKAIIESGFIENFISQYFEDRTYDYQGKDRLRYAMCNSDLDKQQVTNEQIEIVKSKIQKLGYDELSFGYIESCKPDNVYSFIESDKRFDFWLHRFMSEFIDSINSFTPIIEFYEAYTKKDNGEDFEHHYNLCYPDNQKPSAHNLAFIIQREFDLLVDIEIVVDQFNEGEYWEFDFDEFQKFVEANKPMQYLFNISELLVQLSRLEMLNEFIYPNQQDLQPSQTTPNNQQETPLFENNFDNISPNEIYQHFKAGLVDQKYLTVQELNDYLKAAFELKTKPETLFKLKGTPTKQKIYTIFYTYYKDLAQKKHKRQKEYAALLGEYFENYKTEIIQTNWARGYRTKR